MSRRTDPERGRRIRALREGMGLGYEEFAARFDVTKGAIVGWENGASVNCDDYLELLRLGLDAPKPVAFDTPRQLTLPFGQAFSVELRIGPQRAGSVDVRVQLRERTN